MICSTCGKPIAQKAQSNVTRFLSAESRCMCGETAWKLAQGPRAAHQEQPVDPQEAAEIEKNLGDRYKVEALLGRGGMGAVYKVKDTTLDQTFAIKVLNPQLIEDSSSVKRFEQEAKAASNLTHVNLAAVYDFGVGQAGAPYIVMDYLDGQNLADMLAAGGYLDVPRAIDLFIQLTEAIAHAHSKGVIHRDIKPNNIIVESKDGSEIVKVVDFGIAKVLPSAAKTAQMTQTGEIFGSPNYMSPEQCLGNKLDARSDIYQIGCVMYEALTGVSPFAAENPIKAILRHINEDAQPMSVLKPELNIPPALERIVLHCLERPAEDRYQTADALLQDLVAIRDNKPISLKPKPVRPAAAKRSMNPWIFAVMAAAGVIAGVQLLVVAFLHGGISPNTHPNIVGTDPYQDAERLDSLSYSYFMKGDYERAIPLLEFGIKTYKENGTHLQPNQEDTYLADQDQHVGKCYLALNQPDKAVPYYREALRIYRKFGKYPGGGMQEAITDYAKVLRLLGRNADAEKMVNEFSTGTNISVIP